MNVKNIENLVKFLKSGIDESGKLNRTLHIEPDDRYMELAYPHSPDISPNSAVINYQELVEALELAIQAPSLVTHKAWIGDPGGAKISGKKFHTIIVDDLVADTPEPDALREFIDKFGQMGQSTLPDSGKRQGFGSGSVRDSREGKGRYDLITPFGLKRVAQLYEKGAVKYAARNWEKGQPLMRYFDSGVRHFFCWLTDKLSGSAPAEDHLAAVAWNVLAMMDHEERMALGILPSELDDSPAIQSKPKPKPKLAA